MYHPDAPFKVKESGGTTYNPILITSLLCCWTPGFQGDLEEEANDPSWR